MYVFNRVMNEAWLTGELDEEMEGDEEYDAASIERRLQLADDDNCRPGAWREWNARMVAQYSSI